MVSNARRPRPRPWLAQVSIRNTKLSGDLEAHRGMIYWEATSTCFPVLGDGTALEPQAGSTLDAILSGTIRGGWTELTNRSPPNRSLAYHHPDRTSKKVKLSRARWRSVLSQVQPKKLADPKAVADRRSGRPWHCFSRSATGLPTVSVDGYT
jgi:hypothetical protein